MVTRRRVIALAVGVGLLAVYGFFAIYVRPLDVGSDEAFFGLASQTAVDESSAVIGNGPDVPIHLLSYVDGGVDTLVKSLFNRGLTPITITGVETSPPDWLGLVTLKEPRAAVIDGAAPCCQLNAAATWSAQDFRSIQVNPGEERVVALHLLMSNCEDSGSGIYTIIDSIKVHYNVLGFPHVKDVAVGPYWFQSPDTCQRTGPARP